MSRADILDDAEYGAALVAHVSAEGYGTAPHSAAFVHDHVTQYGGRGAIDVPVHVEIAANHHHRAGSTGARRNCEIPSLHLRVSLETRKSNALGVRILHGGGRQQKSQTEHDVFHRRLTRRQKLGRSFITLPFVWRCAP